MRPQRRVARQLAGKLLLLVVTAGFCACSTATNQGTPEQPSSSVQTLEYYPQLVKGYQNSYPARRVLVLLPTDARQFSDPTAAVHTPDNGNPAIGVVLDSNGSITQRLYAQPFQTLVQKAIEQSIEEAGMVPLDSNDSSYQGSRKKGEDYVLEDKIVRCWIKKQRGREGSHDPTWRTTAEFAIDVTIYKPPFRVPYWQGHSSAEFVDPPLTHAFGAADDDTAIYDDPGQVMSIALTRAVAGIFDRDDLRTLITEDRMVHSH